MGRPLQRHSPTIMARPQASTGVRGIGHLPPTTISFRYINTMRQGIFWADAMGVVTTEPGCQQMIGDEAFVIEVEYVFHRDALVDTRELLEPIGDKLHDSLREQIAKEIAQQETRRSNYEMRRFNYRVGITYQELMDLGGVVYLHDVDLVVGFDHYRTRYDHPHSHRGQRRRVEESLPVESGSTVRITIVDNTRAPYHLYHNTGQTVLECVAQADPSLSDGVYVTYRDGSREQPQVFRYTLEEATTAVGLYRSRVEAESYGSPDARFKEKLRESDHALTMQKQETLKIKQDMEEAKALYEQDKRRHEQENERHARERERLLADMELVKQQREYSREYRNDERKEREQERKERTDAWKSLVDVGKASLGVVSVVLSLLVLLKKHEK